MKEGKKYSLVVGSENFYILINPKYDSASKASIIKDEILNYLETACSTPHVL